MNISNEDLIWIKGTHIKAQYYDQIVSENGGNPFIEAIPPRLSRDEMVKKLYSAPKFETSQLKLSPEDRLELVRQIKPSFYIPLSTVYDRYLSLYSMIKIGYQSRNPLTAMYNKQFSIGWDEIWEQGLDSSGANIAGNVQTAQSLAEIGLSGMGKSVNYKRLLRLFPQVIHHGKYKDRHLPYTQVAWMHIECPSNKSVGDLCRNFYSSVDELLGSDFDERYGEKQGTIQKLIKRMVKVASQINLGLLVIDEIQRVSSAHTGGDQRMIEFITEIVNTLGVPVVVMGTFKAIYLFKDSLANSRRGVPDGYAENITDLYSFDNEDWNLFIENLWDLQYTINYSDLTHEIKEVFYFHTLGIPDFAVKLFMHVQFRAIVNGGDELITVELINQVAGKTFKLVQNIFDRIRSGDSNVHKEFDDVKPDWLEFNDYLNEAKYRIQVNGKMAEDHRRAIQFKDRDAFKGRLVEYALTKLNDKSKAESIVEQTFQSSSGFAEYNQMCLQVLELVMDANEKKTENIPNENNSGSLPKTPKIAKVKPIMQEDDLRIIVQQGRKKGLTTEEALAEANIIRTLDDFKLLI